MHLPEEKYNLREEEKNRGPHERADLKDNGNKIDFTKYNDWPQQQPPTESPTYHKDYILRLFLIIHCFLFLHVSKQKIEEGANFIIYDTTQIMVEIDIINFNILVVDAIYCCNGVLKIIHTQDNII